MDGLSSEAEHRESTVTRSDDAETTLQQAKHRRIHYGVLTTLYLGVLVLAGTALGSFGASETNVRNFVKNSYPLTQQANNCILYATYLGHDDINDIRRVALSNAASCGFVLGGQVCVFVVVLLWLVINAGQLVALRPDILSVCRMIDLTMSVVTAILTLVICSMIHAGLDATCQAATGGLTGCEEARIEVDVANSHKLHFFHTLQVSRVKYSVLILVPLLLMLFVDSPLWMSMYGCQTSSSSWLLFLFFIILIVWYTILTANYCYRTNQRRRQAVEDLYDITKPI